MQTFYTVQSGDTLGAIANRFGLTTPALIAANNIPYSPGNNCPSHLE